MKKKPVVIDLYAGVGGLSLGAARAGFEVGAAVEIDRIAIETHGLNFPNTAHIAKDIGSMTGKSLLKDAGLKSIDGLIGGPPCQGFSSMGHQNADDPRNSLFTAFFRLVSEIQPAFFVAENVPGVLAEKNDELRNQALSLIPKKYRVLKPIKIKASDYGAPTIRTRIFFIGYDPKKMNSLQESDFLQPENISDIRVAAALANLPKLHAQWTTEEESWRAVGELGDSVFEQKIMNAIPRGVGNIEAIRKYKAERMVSGFLGTIHLPGTVKRFEQLAPGERDIVSKGMRLDREGYCPTLRAGTGPERGSYQAVRPIHPTSPRVICPREAARLQGFPDWFQFHPTKWHAFRQIGNSVSPIVAEFIMGRLLGALA